MSGNIKNYLFINGAAEVGIDYENKKYYVNADIIHKDGYDYFMEVSKDKFIEVLEDTFKWVANSWNKELVNEYNNLLENVKYE